MAGISVEQGSNNLDVELNLVPFIDLLSTLVLFLLITAVWIQVSTIPATVDAKGKSAAMQTNQSKLLIHVTQSGMKLDWPAGLSGKWPSFVGRAGSGYDYNRLITVLQSAIKSVKNFPVSAVSADDAVSYGVVVQTVDTLKSAGVKNVALSTN